jgi:hypothetical protein
VVPVDEIDEVRIVSGWIADHEPPELALDPPPSPAQLVRFTGEATPPARESVPLPT